MALDDPAEISRHRFTFRNVSAESNTEPYANSREPWTFTFSKGSGQSGLADSLSQLELLPEGYAGQFYRFHEALRNGTELPVTLGDARAALEAVAAAYHSSRTGQPVPLPLGPGHPKYETL